MARLSGVVAAIASELARATMIADQQSRELAAEYESVPILASLSVPRVSLKEANLTLRFVVSDVVEGPRPTHHAEIEGSEWDMQVINSLSALLIERGLNPKQHHAVLTSAMASYVTASEISINDMRRAMTHEDESLIRKSTQSILEAWTQWSSKVLAKLGDQSVFATELSDKLKGALTELGRRRRYPEHAQLALPTVLDVGVRSDELGAAQALVQEVHLTFRADNLDTLASVEEVGSQVANHYS